MEDIETRVISQQEYKSSNLNQLAKASNEGRLILDPDTKESLNQACADMHEIRAEIIRSMWLKPPKGGAPWFLKHHNAKVEII